jgi:hypothetical protein
VLFRFARQHEYHFLAAGRRREFFKERAIGNGLTVALNVSCNSGLTRLNAQGECEIVSPSWSRPTKPGSIALLSSW